MCIRDRLGDYLRLYPERWDVVKQNTADLDPLELASRITAPVLLSLGINDTASCPFAFGEKLADMIPECDSRVYQGASEGGGHEHAHIQLAWLADKLGLG